MKLTKIALVLVTALAMSAMATSAASAAQYKAPVTPIMLYGERTATHTFTVDGQEVSCALAFFEKGSLSTPANEITGMIPSYSGCSAFGFAGANVNMGNCTYTFKQPNAVSAPNNYVAKMGVFCTGFNANINASVFGSECSVSMGQTGNENLSNIGIENVKTEFSDVKFTAAVNGMRFVKNKDNGLCPLSGTGTTNLGTYNGPTIVEATAFAWSVS